MLIKFRFAYNRTEMSGTLCEHLDVFYFVGDVNFP